MKYAHIVAAGGLTLTLVLAPVAHADDADKQFVSDLIDAGIAPVGNGWQAIRNAHHVCEVLHNGEPLAQVQQELYNVEKMPPGPLTQNESNYEVTLAIKYYCPQYKG
jgi:hypothetical protein